MDSRLCVPHPDAAAAAAAHFAAAAGFSGEGGEEPWTALEGGYCVGGVKSMTGRIRARCGLWATERRAEWSPAAGGANARATEWERERKAFFLVGAGAGNVADPILQTGTKRALRQKDSRRPGKSIKFVPGREAGERAGVETGLEQLPQLGLWAGVLEASIFPGTRRRSY